MSEIAAFLDSLDHPRRAEIDRLRTLISEAVPALGERIKWNPPSFGMGEDDCITLKLHPPKSVGVVFHRGAKARQKLSLAHLDPDELLKWAAPDRGIVQFGSLAEIEARAEALQALVKRWVAEALETL